jgi:BirA family transcriptional regulator, biotin operon repressor / biotin---[acetyl-CoA-carboxylase] ligase
MISTGEHLTILESVDSTNNYAMAKVRTGLAKHGDGFFAMAQTAGKGQRGKAWVTAPGTNIIYSLVLQVSALEWGRQFVFSAAIALGARDFFALYAGDETTIKWPNDLYWRDRKAGGILIENIFGSRESADANRQIFHGNQSEANARTSHDARLTPHHSPLTTWSIVGMGININQTSFPADLKNPVSLKQITGKEQYLMALVAELRACVLQRCEQLLAGMDLLPEYNQYLYKNAQKVKFKKGSRVFEGLVKGVNEKGFLLVETDVEEQFGFGEIEWVL